MARPLSPEARQRALEHARSMLLEDGVAALNFEALARHSGVAKTTLYRHWPSRDELLRDTLMELITPATEVDTGSLRTDLEAWAAVRPDHDLGGQVRRIFFLLMEASITDPAVREVQESLLAQQTGPISSMIARAIERGELAPDIDADLALDIVLGPMALRTLIRDRPMDDDMVAVVLDAVWAALRSLGSGV